MINKINDMKKILIFGLLIGLISCTKYFTVSDKPITVDDGLPVKTENKTGTRAVGDVGKIPMGVGTKLNVAFPIVNAAIDRINLNTANILQTQLDTKINADYVIEKVASTYYARPSGSYTAYSGSSPSAVLQSAVSALTSGGLIHIKAGLYDSFDSVAITHNYITIEGEGMYTTILKLKANKDVGRTAPVGFCALIWIKGANYFTIKNLQLDGNFANQTKKDDGNAGNGSISVISCLNGNLWEGGQPGYYHPDYFTMDNCLIKGATRYGTTLGFADKAVIKNTYFLDNGWVGFYLYPYCSNSLIDRCRSEGGGDGGGGVSSGNNTVSNCFILNSNGVHGDGNTSWGLEFSSGGELIWNVHYINNNIKGVHVGIAGTYTRNCTITGNTIDSVEIGTGVLHGMALTGDSGSFVSTNKITRVKNRGIALSGCKATNVSNNDIATDSTASSIGLFLESSTKLYIFGNRIKSVGDWGTGVTIADNFRNSMLMNNTIEGCTKYGDPYDLVTSVTGTTGNVFEKNWGVKTNGWLKYSATATSDGLTTGILLTAWQDITVTSANANYIVALPATDATTIGSIIHGSVGANGFELRVQAAQHASVHINGVATDNVEAAIPASSTFSIECTSATTWILKVWSAAGVYSAPVPDGV
jgi:parallel beta-helix repeat protein